MIKRLFGAKKIVYGVSFCESRHGKFLYNVWYKRKYDLRKRYISKVITSNGLCNCTFKNNYHACLERIKYEYDEAILKAKGLLSSNSILEYERDLSIQYDVAKKNSIDCNLKYNPKPDVKFK